jgi:glycogen synthase
MRIPKRILMTADTVGGVWTYSLDLARSLERYGIEVFIATMGANPSDDQLEEARSIANVSIFKSDYRLEWMENCWRDVRRAGDWLLHLERRLKPDLVHLNGYVHASLRFKCPVVAVCHSCVLSWWKAVRRENPPSYLNEYRTRVRAGLHAADAVIAPSSSMLRSIESHYGALSNAHVVYNGTDSACFERSSGDGSILAAGRVWDEGKNIPILQTLSKEVKRSLFIAGANLEPGCSKGIDFDKSRFLGRLSRSELRAWMSRASIFIAPALYEPFGLAPLEAALSGCALVLSNITSLREIWGDAALFVPARDPAAIDTAISRLMNDGNLRQEMADKAFRRAKRYTTQKMAREYIDVYSDLFVSAAKRKEEVAACAL